MDPRSCRCGCATPDGGCGCATWDGRAMADEELEALRKQRLAELQAKHGVSGRVAGAPPSLRARAPSVGSWSTAPRSPPPHSSLCVCGVGDALEVASAPSSRAGSRVGLVPVGVCTSSGRSHISALAAVEPGANPAGILVIWDSVWLAGRQYHVERGVL